MTNHPVNIADIIRPIITRTYGDNAMSRVLVTHLVDKINNEVEDDPERMIMLTCWDWFPGGTAAANTARKIYAALSDARIETTPNEAK